MADQTVLEAKEDSLDPKVPWMFFIATVSQMIGNTIAGTYLAFYLTDKMGMTAVIMGGVMLASRIADLIIGVSSGAVVQKISLKHGQFRSWLLYAPIAVGLGTTMCFINPAIPMGAKAVMVFIGYIGYGGGMSFIQISTNGMMAKIAGPKIQDRLSISAKVVQGQNVGRLLTSLITLPLILIFEGMGKDGYTIMQVIFVTIGVSGQMVLFVGTKKYEQYDPNFKAAGGAASVKLTTMLTNTLKNGQIVLLMFADTLRSAVLMSIAGLNAYVFRYVVQNMALMTTYLTISSAVGILVAFAARPISAKLGKKNSALLSGAIGSIMYISLGLFGGTNPVLYTVFVVGAAAGIMIITSCGVNLYLDCAEYQLFKTGQDNRTFAMSMIGVTVKLGFVASSVIVSAFLEFAGYDSATQTMSDPAMLIRSMGLIFGGCYVLYFVLMLFYKITEDKSREYAEHNHRVAQERAKATATAE